MDITTGVIDIHLLKPPRITCGQFEIEKIYAMVTQEDLIDLWGDCEFTMNDYVEWLLQDRDTEPSL